MKEVRKTEKKCKKMVNIVKNVIKTVKKLKECGVRRRCDVV